LTLVDTNVLLDLVLADARLAHWSLLQLKIASLAGPVAINDVIYAEPSVRYESVEDLDSMVSTLGVRLETIPRSGLFMAAKAFRRYRAQGGTRTGVVPDFFIGAHAVSVECVLLTRDEARYRTYFPTVRLILPD
jgi:predicted nucleic acid-binding protein